jgi:cytochrome oxidase Cu insertion factor (SCO1/SenC/PrrC family)
MNRSHRVAAFAAVALLGLSAAVVVPVRAQDEDAPKAIALGSAVPMKTTAMKNIDGKSVTLAGAAGKKGTLVFFICNHCPFVKAWQTRIAAVGNAARTQGIGVVAINSNDPEVYPEDAYPVMKQRAKAVGYKFAYVVDETSDVARAFGASHTPEAFLFDASGKLVYHGAIDDNGRDEKAVQNHWLQDAVAAVQSGKPVQVAETKSIGCGIKARDKKKTT